MNCFMHQLLPLRSFGCPIGILTSGLSRWERSRHQVVKSKGILPKMAKAFWLRIHNKLLKCWNHQQLLPLRMSPYFLGWEVNLHLFKTDAWKSTDSRKYQFSKQESQCVRKFVTLRITGPCYRGVWMCIAGVGDLQTTSFEIPWFLG